MQALDDSHLLVHERLSASIESNAPCITRYGYQNYLWTTAAFISPILYLLYPNSVYRSLIIHGVQLPPSLSIFLQVLLILLVLLVGFALVAFLVLLILVLLLPRLPQHPYRRHQLGPVY